MVSLYKVILMRLFQWNHINQPLLAKSVKFERDFANNKLLLLAKSLYLGIYFASNKRFL